MCRNLQNKIAKGNWKQICPSGSCVEVQNTEHIEQFKPVQTRGIIYTLNLTLQSADYVPLYSLYVDEGGAMYRAS